ncbi:hypothetical protein R6Q57_010966 [Mikania cordata]
MVSPFAQGTSSENNVGDREVIMVYTLGSVVNRVQSEFPAVRLSTLVEHLDSLIRTHARLMKDRRCGSFLWSLLPTRFTPVYRSNSSKLTSSMARMTSSLTLLSLNSLALTSQLHS